MPPPTGALPTVASIRAAEQSSDARRFFSVPCISIGGAIYRADIFTALIPGAFPPGTQPGRPFPRTYYLERANGKIPCQVESLVALQSLKRALGFIEPLDFAPPPPAPVGRPGAPEPRTDDVPPAEAHRPA